MSANISANSAPATLSYVITSQDGDGMPGVTEGNCSMRMNAQSDIAPLSPILNQDHDGDDHGRGMVYGIW